MGKALYRKYRSKNLSEIVGQEHITTTLSRALEKGTISHAYLFTGPRGVGKTSIARILAHEVNGLPYDESIHLDIIEIDAASNRRIDEIRDLREHVHSAPTSGKYKVYIIDEVHMLTKEAFNALLKTLEEPPAHVIFILATTEAHKLPETIISRTQRFTFKPVAEQQAIGHLRNIAKTEGVEIDDETLKLIAEHGQGSFRDSISLLDQVSSGQKQVSIENVRSTLGIAPTAIIDEIVSALVAGSASNLLEVLDNIRVQGYHTAQISKQLAKLLRNDLLNDNLRLPRSVVTNLLQQLISVPASPDPATLLELILISSLPEDNSIVVESVTTKNPTTSEPRPKSSKTITPQPEISIEPEVSENTEPEPVSESETVVLTKKEAILDEATWQEALTTLKKRHNTLYGIARMASPTFSDNNVTLSFTFPFHQKRLDDAKNKKILANIVSELMGGPVSISCIVDASSAPRQKPKSKTPESSNKDLENISNIFGDAEVVD